MTGPGKPPPAERRWRGAFGAAYTRRNRLSLDEVDELYLRRFGIGRRRLNELFLAGVDRKAPVLEVGCNIGVQLGFLQEMGFSRRYGVDIQTQPLRQARAAGRGRLSVAAASALPFPDRAFELVFTSGLLIHVPPPLLDRVAREILRVSRRYVWGFEYYAESCREISYQGETGLLWKNDFVRVYLDTGTPLRLRREVRLRHLDQPLVDTMFLLERR